MTEEEFCERLRAYGEIQDAENELLAYHITHRDLGAEQDAELELASNLNELENDAPEYERKSDELTDAFHRAYPYRHLTMRTDEMLIERVTEWLKQSEPKRTVPQEYIDRLKKEPETHEGSRPQMTEGNSRTRLSLTMYTTKPPKG